MEAPDTAMPDHALRWRTDLSVFLWMLVLAVAAYAPVACMQYALKWDMVDCYLPWRHFAADAFAHGTFPLWDPYQSLGYPIYGDLRSVFYPDALFAGIFLGGFGVRTLHVLFIVHLALAGTGMYLLAGHFARRTDARVLTGMAYLLCGFFTGHGQEMFGIIAATWVPFVLYHAIHVLQGDGRGAHPPKLAVVLFLQVVGGYQAMTIMLFYLLLALAVVIVVGRVRAGDRVVWRSMFPKVALGSLAVVASLAMLLVTYVDIAPHIGRFSGMALEKAQVNPFPPQALISLLVPYAAVADSAAFGTDISMTNGYVGLLPLMGFMFALFRRRTIIEHVVLWWGVLCLLASFGPHTPVRQWLFEHVPLMDLFRMPSFFSYYTMLAILLVGVSELGRWLDSPPTGVLNVRRGALMLLAVMLGVIAMAWWRSPDAWNTSPTAQGSIAEHVLVQAPWQAVLLGSLAVVLWLARRKPGVLRPALFVFLVVEMGGAVRRNMPTTVVSLDVPVAHVARVLDEQPPGAMVPDPRRPIADNRDDAPDLWPLWRNTGNFTKLVSAEGFNSFQIDAYRRFGSESVSLLEGVRRGPPMFLSYALCPEQRWVGGGAAPGELVVPDSVHAQWSDAHMLRGATDTLIVERFEPGVVQCRVRTEASAVLTLAQMDHPGWEVHVDGQRRQHAAGHLALISIPIDAGEHRVEFRFSRPAVVWAYVASYLAFCSFIALALFHGLRRRRRTPVAAAGAAVLVLVPVLLVTAMFRTRPSYEEQTRSDMNRLAQAIGEAVATERSPVFADVDRPDLLDQAVTEVEHFRTGWPNDVFELGRRLAELRAAGARSVVLAGRGAAVRPEVEELFMSDFPVEQRLVDERGLYVRRYAQGGTRPALHRAHRSANKWVTYVGHAGVKPDSADGGAMTWRVDLSDPGGPPFEAAFGDIGSTGAARLVFAVDAMREARASDASLYIVIERAGGDTWSLARRISSFVPDTAEWGRAILVARPPCGPGTDDRIKAFVWNDGQAPVFLRDLRFETFVR